MISGVSSSSGFGFDRFYLSGAERQGGRSTPASEKSGATPEKQAGSEEVNPSGSSKPSSELDAEQQRQIAKLVETDRKVRAHEQAHMSAGGDLVRGAASFEYETGPDGKRYAVGGEVSIDTTEGRTPAETVVKAQRIYDAAMAPADPSPQDHSVASMAMGMKAEATQELNAQQTAQSGRTPASPTEESASTAKAPSANESAVAAYQSVGFFKRSNGFSAYA